MTGARTSFTCSTELDQDIIEWLDSFGSRDRGYAIKAALRAYMLGETSSTLNEETNFTSLEEKISNLYREVITVRKQNEKILAFSINNDIIKPINNDLSNEEVHPDVLDNISNLLNED